MVQVALALVLLVGSGLMIRTFQALSHVQPGFTQPEQILTLRISIPSAQVPEPERVARMYNDILDRIAAIPGVDSVSLSNSTTMDGSKSADPIFAEDRPTSEDQLPPIRRYKYLSPGYFQAMGNRVLAGRDFTWTDIHAMRPVALVSENLAREYWETPAAAIGKRIRENPKGTWREIVGVVGNERDNGIDKEAPTIVYWPLMIRNFWSAPIEVRRTLAFAIRSKRTGSDTLLERNQPGSMDGELGPSFRKRSHRQRNLRSVDGAQFIHPRDARSCCGYGSVARCGGYLRRHLIFALAADSRDWNSHGPWRNTTGSESDVRSTRIPTGSNRSGLWRGCRHTADSPDVSASVRS